MPNPSLPRFTPPNPLAESRPWESPYIYCGTNPVNATDPAGMEWNINSWCDDDDLLHIDMTITGVVYNASNEKFNEHAFARKIQQQLDDVFTLSGDGFQATMKSDIRVAEKAEDVTGNNHLFIVVDQERLFDSETELANTDMCGLSIRVGTRLVRDMLKDRNQRSIAHEVGHTGGLPHANEESFPVYDVATNLMTQIQELPRRMNINAAINLELKQLMKMDMLYSKEKLNQHIRPRKAAIKKRN